MKIKVATWNVNSIRARLERLLAWLEKAEPHVVCLQELKVPDEDFPAEEMAEAGYHAAVHGQRTYNGVAILSRESISNVSTGMGNGVSDPEARIIRARTYEIDVVSVYVPNGREVGSDKWDYKLEWLSRLGSYVERSFNSGSHALIAGDFNIAPEDRDVANPDRWRESVLCHAAGREKLEEIVGRGLVDAIRLHHHNGGPYSWWDYRRLAFPKGDGLRIDHILTTGTLAERCVDAYVERDERKGKKPSDHAPVVAVFDL